MRADWLSALALMVFATGCTHSEPAETSAAVPANTPGVARPSEPAPTPREVQDDPVYQRWLDRLGVGSCGAAERLVPSDARYAPRSKACLRAAERAGRGAEAMLTYNTVEGDPVRTYVRILSAGQVEVFVDGTEDGFGSGTWVYRKCDNLREALPLKC